MFKAHVNGTSHDVQQKDGQFIVDGKAVDVDIARVEGKHFHLLMNNKSFRAEVIDVDHASKVCSIKINGRTYTVTVKDKFDLLLEKMGMQNNGSSKVNSVKAPMPGLIVELKVKDGDKVEQGDQLVILEAMKMENVIKSPGAGVVKSVRVSKGISVEKGQVLIEFDR